tara:strand:+ start:90 stop:743 length:654 start_codon:yes stop_codon:yes gene_type:complete
MNHLEGKELSENNKSYELDTGDDPRWYDDISIISKKPMEFFPSSELSTNCKINAMARFSIYFSLFIILMNRSQKWLSLSVTILIISLFIGTTEGFTNESFGNEESCVKPTEKNPFMNFTLEDYYKNSDRPANCSVKKVRKEISEKFLSRIEPDPADLWGQNISDRSFYTMPNTRVVNDQKGFAEWCYGKIGECKSDGKNCLKRALTRTSNGMFTTPF